MSHSIHQGRAGETEGELVRQHDRWAASHVRLWGKDRRPAKIIRVVLPSPEPELVPAPTITALVATYGWPPYAPPLPYDAYVEPPPQPPRTLKQIAKEVCAKHQISYNDLISPRRNRFIVIARQEAFWRCREETPCSLPQIGRDLGGKDHTTVLHGIRVHERRIAEAKLSTGRSGDNSADLLAGQSHGVFMEDRPNKETVNG